MSNITGDGESFSSENNTGGGEVVQQQQQQLHRPPPASQTPPRLPPVKKKRNLPGTPDPAAEVIALSPATLTATNRFVCEICSKGFQRDQNLQLHRRGHNLPWKLRQRTTAEARKRVYICPEPSCVHHSPGRALGDLTGIKKHFCRKHGEKKWECDRCSKKYAVQSDWKAHSKTCGTREYKCDCGTIFSRRDSFITHRAFCDALAEEENNSSTNNANAASMLPTVLPELMIPITAVAAAGPASISISDFKHHHPATTLSSSPSPLHLAAMSNMPVSPGAHMSATALLQKAARIGATASGVVGGGIQGPAYANTEGLGMMGGGISSGGGGGVYGHAMNHQMFDVHGGDQGMHVFGDHHHHHHQSNNWLLMKRLEQQQQQHASSGSGVMTVDFLGLRGAKPAATTSFDGTQGGLHHHFHHHHLHHHQQQQMDKAMWEDL